MTLLEKIEDAKELIGEYLEKYPGSPTACSFGKDSMVVFHLARQVDPEIQVFTVFTPFIFKETREYSREMIGLYDMDVEFYERRTKDRLYDTCPTGCCDFYKVDMTRKALRDKECWFAGLRADEGAERAEVESVVSPDRFGKTKVNPILDFTEKDVWRYLAINNIPANPLYKKGYRSLGCKPCSDPEQDENESERAGRWRTTDKQGRGCGIHSI